MKTIFLFIFVFFLNSCIYADTNTTNIINTNMQDIVHTEVSKFFIQYMSSYEQNHFQIILWILGVIGTFTMLALVYVAWHTKRLLNETIQKEVRTVYLEQYKVLDDYLNNVKTMIEEYKQLNQYADDKLRVEAVNEFRENNIDEFGKIIQRMINNAELRNIIRQILDINNEINDRNRKYITIVLDRINNSAERKNILNILIDKGCYKDEIFKELYAKLYKNNKEHAKTVAQYLTEKAEDFAKEFLVSYSFNEPSDKIAVLKQKIAALEKKKKGKK